MHPDLVQEPIGGDFLDRLREIIEPLEATDLAGAKQLAERIRKDVGALILDSDQGAFRVSMSIGVACFPDDARLRPDLVERADMALYRAKETGRNRTPDKLPAAERFQAIRRPPGGDIQKAVVHGIVFVQPLVRQPLLNRPRCFFLPPETVRFFNRKVGLARPGF